MGVVYVATCSTSGRSYVGSTTCTLDFRRDGHRRAANAGSPFPLHRAIRKHGWSDFTWRVLEECDDTVLHTHEEDWIARMDSYRRGYNATPLAGGGRVGGWHHTEESRAKMSAVHAARSDEEKERIRESWRVRMQGNSYGRLLKGCKFTPEHKDRIRAALTGRVRSPEHSTAISLALTGRKHGQEFRDACSAGQRGRKRSVENIAKAMATIAANSQLRRWRP